MSCSHVWSSGVGVPTLEACLSVPTISVFYGIVIRMFFKDHRPPHFHARAARLVREWTVLHRSELEANWGRLKAGAPLEKIAPLE